MRRLAVLLLACAHAAGGGVPRGPFVRLAAPDRHTSAILAIAAAPSTGRVYTAGQDKAIREWDAGTGKPLRTFRIPIGGGHGGYVYALDVTADGSRLAFGALHPAHDEGAAGIVGLVDLGSGRLTGVAECHPGGIASLAFAPDGRRLLSVGLEDRNVLGWTVGDGGTLLRGGVVHAGTCAAWLDPSRYAVGKGDEATLHAWEGDGAAKVASTRIADSDLLAAARGKGAVFLATTAGVWSWAGRGDAARVGENPSETIAVSPDGSRAVTWDLRGEGDREARENLFVHAAGRAPIATELKDAIPFACAWVASDRIWVGDGEGRLARLVVGGDALAIAQRDTPRAIVAVGTRKQTIAWGTVRAGGEVHPNRRGDLTEAFDLRVLGPMRDDLAGFERAVWEGDPGAEIEDGLLRIRAGGKTVAWTPPTDEEISCWTFLDRSRLAVGTNRAIHVVRAATGVTERTCIGHEGDVLALAPMDGGRRFASGSADMTIRIWSPDAPEYLVALHVDREEGEWVAWTPLGYYASSPRGDRLVGWHFNIGLSEPPVFMPADRMVSTLYRPDIVERALALGDVRKAVATARPASGEGAPGLATPEDLARILPPEVAILHPRDGEVVEGRTLHAKFRVAPGLSCRPVREVRVEVNERKGPVDLGAEPLSGESVFGCEIELDEGENEIVLLASNGHAQSARIRLTSVPATSGGTLPRGLDVPRKTARLSARSPVVTVLAIGSARYGEHGLHALPYGVKDAERIHEAFGATGREVRPRLVADPDRGEVIRGLEWFKENVVEGGLAILYLSGHGIKDEAGDYYYVPGRYGGLLASDAVPWTDFVRAVGHAGKSARVLFLLDTCHAGGAGGIGGGFHYADPTIAAKQLEGLDVGIVILAAAGYSQPALESREWGGGAFTSALVGCVGVAREGPLRVDRLILEVKDGVRDLTGGRQKVEAMFESNRQPEFVVLE